MSIYTTAIEKLYVAYFSRPADAGGLAYWEGVVAASKGDTSAVSAAFAGSAEYKAAYANLNGRLVIDTIYMNLFGRHAEPGGLAYWGPLLQQGVLTVDIMVTAVAGGAQNADLVAYNSKVAAATAFTAALDTPEKVRSYEGPSALSNAIAFIAGVTDTASGAAAVTAANLNSTLAAIGNPSPWALTAADDRLTGTTGNDVFRATKLGMNYLDQVNGGLGNDTLSIFDNATLPEQTAFFQTIAFNLKSIEDVSVTTSGGAFLDLSAMPDLQTLKVVNGGTGLAIVYAPSSADVLLAGSRLSSAHVRGGRDIVVDLAGAVGPRGEGITSVHLDGLFGASATLIGAPVPLLSLDNIGRASTITVADNAAGNSLSIFLSRVGYADANGSLPVKVTVADQGASRVTLFARDASNAITLVAPSATALTLSADTRLIVDMNAAINSKITTIDNYISKGDIWLEGLSSVTRAITTGTGADHLTLTTATATILSAVVQTGAGNDTVFLRTTGNGMVNVDTGADDDVVTLESNSGAEKFQITLGAGNDKFIVTGGAIKPADRVNGGDGTDSLTLKAVTGANAAAFSGFEQLNAAGLNATVDLAGLAALNAIKTVFADAAVGTAAKVINVAAGTELVAQSDMGTSTLALAMASPVALTVRVDIDESGAPDTTGDSGAASFSVTNASSVNIVFQSDFLPQITGESLIGDNLVTLTLASAGTTVAAVSSGGTLANNVLTYADVGNTLTSMTVSGPQKLQLALASTSVSLIDARLHTGGLTVSTASLGNGGTIKLGAGTDAVDVAITSTSVAFETLEGFEKSAAAALGPDAVARAFAIADADTLIIAGGRVASAVSVSGGAVDARGVLGFTGQAPASLQEAFAIADRAAESINEVLVFSYQGDSYAFSQGGATDTVVKLTGVTGVAAIVGTGNDVFFLV